ncbi:uncharacterized protein LOC122261879 [Penaeus japonicus]|uniref:uncharacterized protein LOC122261879 n=1 Tax=Penaeus japonicus TaxID=27405 RepID=UPI001C714206|nr:uncharacterized protein LOC122261879 [Penaeus japonicus]
MSMTSPSPLLLLLVGVALQATLCLGCPAPFKTFGGRWCLNVVVAAPKDGPGASLVWNEARAACGEAASALAVIDSHEKLQLLSRFIDEQYPAETEGGWTYLVGAQNVNSKWIWSNSADVNLASNLWVPGHPTPQGETSLLVPIDQVHGRRYIISNAGSTRAPGYICERF